MAASGLSGHSEDAYGGGEGIGGVNIRGSQSSGSLLSAGGGGGTAHAHLSNSVSSNNLQLRTQVPVEEEPYIITAQQQQMGASANHINHNRLNRKNGAISANARLSQNRREREKERGQFLRQGQNQDQQGLENASSANVLEDHRELYHGGALSNNSNSKHSQGHNAYGAYDINGANQHQNSNSGDGNPGGQNLSQAGGTVPGFATAPAALRDRRGGQGQSLAPSPIKVGNGTNSTNQQYLDKLESQLQYNRTSDTDQGVSGGLVLPDASPIRSARKKRAISMGGPNCGPGQGMANTNAYDADQIQQGGQHHSHPRGHSDSFDSTLLGKYKYYIPMTTLSSIFISICHTPACYVYLYLSALLYSESVYYYGSFSFCCEYVVNFQSLLNLHICLFSSS